MRERPYTDMPSLITELVDGLVTELDRPFAIFGYSMGAIIAFEATRELRRRALPLPALLMVAATSGPQLPRDSNYIYSLPDDAFVRAVETRYGELPGAVVKEPDLLRLFLPTLRADLQVFETYTYSDEPPLDCPIVAYGGARDLRHNQERVAAWEAMTTQRFALHMVEGDHFFIRSHLDELLRDVRVRLEELVA
jgi:medium-chain acyl-[acyl-carrier-protein] hydrolase